MKKFIRFQDQDKILLGLLDDDQIYTINSADSLQDIIAQYAQQANFDFLSVSPEPTHQLSNITLLAPLTPQRNVMCVGWNYLKHFEESIGKREQYEVEELPENPTLFSKLSTTVTGPYDEVPLHENFTEKLDWEVELALIIGKEGKNISEENAMEHVFGYCIANDISARDLQRAHGGQWFRGKSLDDTCPLGPWVVPATEMPNVKNLALECSINGTLRQKGNTKNQIFPIEKLISIISAGTTLMPGDIILTGTPDGIGAAHNPPIFLKDGDLIESTITHLGSMKNRVCANL